MKLDRMRCPTCGRQVAFRLIRDPRHTRGMTAPGIRKPVRHKYPLIRDSFGVIGHTGWCPAGEP